MLHIFMLCLLVVFVSTPSARAQATGDPPSPEYSNGALEMTVEHAKPHRLYTREGDNLYGILTISLKNISEEMLTIVRGSPACDFAIEIRDSLGNAPKLTPLGESLPKSEAEWEECSAVSYATVEVQPGKEYVERWPITKYFQLEPGQPYTVKLRWAKGLPAKTRSGRPLRRELSRTLTLK